MNQKLPQKVLFKTIYIKSIDNPNNKLYNLFMDQLDAMSNARSILDNSVVSHRSKPPLRWFANWAGSIASKGILEISYMEDVGYTGFKYRYYSFLWDTFWPIYEKYGTFYTLDMDLSGNGWDDYDEDGIPYWEKIGTVDPHYDFDPLECLCKNCDEDSHCPGCMDCDNDYLDPETGDAFRVISKNE